MSNRTRKGCESKLSSNGQLPNPHNAAPENDAKDQAPRDPSSTPTAPNPFDPSRYRLDQDYLSQLGITEVTSEIPVTRPKADEWVRVHPGDEYRYPAGVVETKSDRDLYLVDCNLWPRLKTEPLFQVRVLYLGVTTEGKPFLWPVRVPGPDGKMESWIRVPLTAIEHAKVNWTRFYWDSTTRKHCIRITDAEFAEVRWPNLSMDQLLDIAFKDRIVSDLAHPVLQNLLRGKLTND
jgi:hypothetical protein